MDDNVTLPVAVVRRVVRAKLDAARGENPGPHSVQVQKEAMQALNVSATVFVNYTTTIASEVARDAGRQTIQGTDVMTALKDCDFGDIADALRDVHQEQREAAAAKKRGHRRGGETDRVDDAAGNADTERAGDGGE